MLFSWKVRSCHGEVMRGRLCSKGLQRPTVALGTISESERCKSEKESGFKWKQGVVLVAEIRIYSFLIVASTIKWNLDVGGDCCLI